MHVRNSMAPAIKTVLSTLMVTFVAGVLPASAQTCPTVVDSVNPRTIDPEWPTAYLNKFPLMPAKIPAPLSRACVQTPTGFSTHLFASENALFGGIKAPVAMTWDEKGRLWLAESFDYPHGAQASFAGNDRIVILEDRNGDGIADTLKVFAQGLNLVTGLVHTVDGLVVAMAPRILLFKDENGDDVADSAGRILYQGFGRNDTHGNLSNLTYGLDNWVYGMMGYNSSNIGGVQFQGSIWRAKSDGSAIERLTPSSGDNTWGLGQSETGQLFYSRANRDHSRHLAFPGTTVAGSIVVTPTYKCAAAPNEIPAVPSNANYSCPRPVTHHWLVNNPGFTSTSNHSIYTARHFPQSYWDRAAFVCEAPRHLCHTMFLQKNNSSWSGTETAGAYNIFASTDAWTAPIAAHTGPDGAVWVLDWYNYLVSHNWNQPIGTGNAQISAIRDNQHSRIYRVTYDGRPLDAILDLSTMNEDQLLEVLHHSNMLWRLHAQRLLVKRGSNPGLVTKLNAKLNLLTLDEMGETPVVIHALRTLEGLGLFAADPATWVPVLRNLMLHPSPGVRWNAIDALPNHATSATAILEQGRINDPDAHVRLRALHKLSTLPGTKSGQMYAPWASLDANTQNRFNAVGGLSTSASMPSVPPLQTGTSVEAGTRAPFVRSVGATWRGGTLQLTGVSANARGALAIRTLSGAKVATLRVRDGRADAAGFTPVAGTYLFRLELDNGPAGAGKFTIHD